MADTAVSTAVCEPFCPRRVSPFFRTTGAKGSRHPYPAQARPGHDDSPLLNPWVYLVRWLPDAPQSSCGKNSVSQAAAVHDLQQQQVLDNLAMFVYDYNSMPYFSYPNQSGAQVTDQANASASLGWGRVNLFRQCNYSQGAVSISVQRGWPVRRRPAVAAGSVHRHAGQRSAQAGVDALCLPVGGQKLRARRRLGDLPRLPDPLQGVLYGRSERRYPSRGQRHRHFGMPQVRLLLVSHRLQEMHAQTLLPASPSASIAGATCGSCPKGRTN